MIDIIGSGSSGNCYWLEGEPPLLIEAGIAPKEIQIKKDFRLSQVGACLVTHIHKDHCKYVHKLLDRGIDCYLTKEVKEDLGLSSHRTHLIEPLKRFKAKGWVITPFDVEHDTGNPLGFLIENNSEKIVYSGDTAFIKYKFQNLTRIMIECNWSEETYTSPLVQKKRLLKTHFNLDKVKDFLNSNNLDKVKEILLLHISSRNGDPEYFKKEIEKIVDKKIRVRYE